MENPTKKRERKACAGCARTFIPSGANCPRCAECRTTHNRERQRLADQRHRERRGQGKGYNQKGPRNNAWKGGCSPGYYKTLCFSSWGRACFGCGRGATVAHHRDRDRDNNVPNNLTPLCKRCHQVLHRCEENLPKKGMPVLPPKYRPRPCPACGVIFKPAGPRGTCEDCRAKGRRAAVKYKPRRCRACGRMFEPDSPGRARCRGCSPRPWSTSSASVTSAMTRPPPA